MLSLVSSFFKASAEFAGRERRLDRQTCDRHRLASQGVPSLLDLENPARQVRCGVPRVSMGNC
jgi:hypothetical protein